jgi:hypothetical protein
MKKMFNEENQIHNFMFSSGSGTVINYGSGSGSDFLTSYGSGSGSTSQKVTVPTFPVPVPVPQHWSSHSGTGVRCTRGWVDGELQTINYHNADISQVPISICLVTISTVVSSC